MSDSQRFDSPTGLKHREERVISGELKPSAKMFGDVGGEEPEVLYDKGFTTQQMSMVESSTVVIEEREREIQSIVQSISEINEMYRDLATMIVDQVIFSLSPSQSYSLSYMPPLAVYTRVELVFYQSCVLLVHVRLSIYSFAHSCEDYSTQSIP